MIARALNLLRRASGKVVTSIGPPWLIAIAYLIASRSSRTFSGHSYLASDADAASVSFSPDVARARREANREEVREEVDLDRALAKGGDAKRERAERVVEVLAEALPGDLGGEVAVGRAEDAHVERDVGLPSEPHNRARLERRHQLRLRARRELADAVEQQRPPARRFEVADRPRGPAAPLVPEERPLEQHVGQVRAVDADERPVRPRAPAVDLGGDDLLPDPGFPLHQHRRVGAGELLREREDVAHLRVGDRDPDAPVVLLSVALRPRRRPLPGDRRGDEDFAHADPDRVPAHHHPPRVAEGGAVDLRAVATRRVLANQDGPLAHDARVLARDARVVDRDGRVAGAAERRFVAVEHLDHARPVSLVDEEKGAPARPPKAVGELHPERSGGVVLDRLRYGDLGRDRD